MADGWIILDKPSGITSRAAGTRVARMFGARTFGHVGTLDPMASGVLPIAIGAATRMIPFVEDARPSIKEYLFSVQFGTETDTLDITGAQTVRTDIIPTTDAVINALGQFIGDTKQTPPMYSAVHIDGRRAYELARQGMAAQMPARRVHIDALKLISCNDNLWTFCVRCGRGTYIRALARDIAAACGTVATVSMIRRTETIGYDVKNAVKLDFLENLVNNGADFSKYLEPTDFGLGDIPVLNLDDKSAKLYKNGGFIATNGANGLQRVYSDSKFIGIGIICDNVLRPKRTIK